MCRKRKRVVLGLCLGWMLFLMGLISRQFYVNGVYIGQASRTDGKGQQMPDRSCGIHMVEEDCFLPVGDNSHSFDGRYYGTVPLECIKNKAVLILPTGWSSRLWR